MPEASPSRQGLVRNILLILLVGSAIGLGIWQYQIIRGNGASVAETSSTDELSFKLTDGTTVALPDENSQKYVVVIFWTSQSQRCLSLLADAAKLATSPETDSILQFYFVNPNETSDVVQEIADSLGLGEMAGYDPVGKFMSQASLRALPSTVLFSNTGKVLDNIEGYEKGQLEQRIHRWIRIYNVAGSGGHFKFDF